MRSVNSHHSRLESCADCWYSDSVKTDLQTEVGRRIRARREALDVSQEDFARGAEIERSFYGKIERGTQNVTLETLARIALKLDVDLGELLAGLPSGASSNRSER